MSLYKPFRKIFFGLLAIVAFSYGWKLYAYQQQGGLTPPPKPNQSNSSSTKTADVASSPAYNGSPLRVGERLTFNVTFSDFATAARLEMEVVEQGVFFGQDSYQIRTKAETLGQVRSLFGDIDHQYVSYVNTKTAIPYRLVSSIRQGTKQTDETVIFDQPKETATFSDESIVSITRDTYDITSLLYALRLRGVPEDGKQKFTALLGKELVEFEAVHKGRERLVTQTGTYNAIQIKLYPQNKKYNKYRGYVWLSDDSQRLPITIKAKLSFGEVRADLTSASITVRNTTPLAKIIERTDESGGAAIPGGLPVPNNVNKGNPVIIIEPPSVKGNLPTPAPNLPFVVGERLSYEVAWGQFTSVGKASFEVRQQGMFGTNRVFELYGEASTVGAARTLINVNDQASSFVRVDSLLPVKTDIRLREGRRTKQTTANYDWSKKLATLTNGTEVSIQSGTLDILSLFYSVRAAELKIGASYNFPFLDANHRLQMVKVNVVKQETIGGPMGTRETLQLDILTPEPTPILLAQVWVSSDARRLPLYFATRTRFGELRFQMTSATNLK